MSGSGTGPGPSARATPPVEGAWEHREELLRYARRLLGAQAELAEDLVQEAYLRLHERVASGRPVRDARPWLFRVTRNLALDERRRSRRGDAALTTLVAVAPPSRGPLEVLQGREEARAALRGIDSLPPRERRTVILDQAGLAPPAIARRIGTTTNAVHQSLFRARRRMRDARAAAWGLLPLPLVRVMLRAAGSPALEGLPALAPGSGGRMTGGAGLAGLVAVTLIGGGVVAEHRIAPHPAPAPTVAHASSSGAGAGAPAPAGTISAGGPVVPDRSPAPRPTARVAAAATRAARPARRDDAGDAVAGGPVAEAGAEDSPRAASPEIEREDEVTRTHAATSSQPADGEDHGGADGDTATTAAAPGAAAAAPEDGHAAAAPVEAAPPPETTTTSSPSEPE